MAYTVPEKNEFDSALWAENKTIRANQTQSGIIANFVAGYEDFWGVENGTSRHTKEEMQAIIDKMPSALDILTDAYKFKVFAAEAFPGMLDAKYSTGVFAISVNSNGVITVGDLNEAWVPVVETPETPEVV
jgi:hypothetical protein